MKFLPECNKEFESNNIDEALWAKLVAVNLGDEVKAKYEYIQIRAGRLAAQAYTEPSETPIVVANTDLKTVKVRVQEYALNHNLTDGHVVDLIRGNRLKGIREEGEWYVLIEPDALEDPDQNVEASPGLSFQSEFMLLTEFARIKGIDEKKVISMIRDGFYVGRKQDDIWYVSRTELGNNSGGK